MQNEKNILKTTLVCQVCMVVRDVKKAADQFAKLIGVSCPKIFIANEDGSDTVYMRGERSQGRVKMAFFHMENLDLEFLEPTEDATSWKEFLDEKGPGVHHIAFKAKNRMMDTAHELEEFGYPIVQYGDKYLYVDSADELGVILELLDID